jgi:hypothetical protein
MKTIFYTLLVGSFYLFNAKAATNAAASLSAADIQAAVNLCAKGDTALLPTGTGTLAGTVTVTNGITVRGAGTNLTRLDGNGTTMFVLSLPTNMPVRFTGMLLNQVYNSAYAIEADGPCWALRVDHNIILGGSVGLFVSPAVYGVVDHNSFASNNIAIKSTALGDGGASLWTNAIEMASSTNALFIEDNNIFNDKSNQERIYAQPATRWIVRFNPLIQSKVVGGSLIMPEEYGTGGARGPVQTIVYSNTLEIGASSLAGIYWRGGMMTVFSNNFIGANAAAGEYSGTCILYHNLGGFTGWPYPDGPSNSFIFANTINGTTPVTLSWWDAGNKVCCPSNFAFFGQPPSGSNGGDGTNNVGAYAGAMSALLAYPHPLVTAQDGAAPASTNNGKSLSISGELRVGVITRP